MHNLELVTNDDAALCMLFVDGRFALCARGGLVATVRSGQHVRWFVRPRKRKAGLSVTLSHDGVERVVYQGPCDPVIAIGEYVPEKPRRRSRAASARGSAAVGAGRGTSGRRRASGARGA